MKLATLDLDTLRTLVTAHDLGGHGQAAERLGRTPSAISLQMKRLQHAVGATLFRKNGRSLLLTEAGEIVLRYARQMLALNDDLLHTLRGASLTGSVRLGFSQDFAETVLPAVLAQFAKLYPLVTIEIRIEGNAALVEAVEKDQLDLALAIGQPDRASAELLGELELVWIAGGEFNVRKGQPLPLLLLGPQCAIRKEMIRKLDQAGIAWRIAAVSPSLAGLWASAAGGLGITARSRLGLPANLACGPLMFGLPPLKRLPVTLHGPTGASNQALRHLCAIISQVVAAVLPEENTVARSRHLTHRRLAKDSRITPAISTRRAPGVK
jgi:DNA-binding transcriptional LysR family regulator